MTHDKLKLCPFCGGKVSVVVDELLSAKNNKAFYYIRCYEKVCDGRNLTTTDKTSLITNWNKRKTNNLDNNLALIKGLL